MGSPSSSLKDRKPVHTFLRTAKANTLSPGLGVILSLSGVKEIFFQKRQLPLKKDHFYLFETCGVNEESLCKEGFSKCLTIYYPNSSVRRKLDQIISAIAPGYPIELFYPMIETMYRGGDPLGGILKQLGDQLSLQQPLELEITLEKILAEVLTHYVAFIHGCLEKIRVVKCRTRMEIVRNLILVRDHIETHFCEELTTKKLSRLATMSEAHFLKYFKQLFGSTPHQYIVTKRLQMAKDLLEQSDLSVHHITTTIGFEDSSSFIRLFRNQYAVTPKKYRLRSMAC